MTNQQKVFCHKYVSNGFNATQAAIDSKYAERSARSTASRLLTKDNIKAYIQKLIRDMLSETDQLTYRWLQEVQAIAFTDIAEFQDDDGDLLPIKEMSPRARAALNDISVHTKYTKDGDTFVTKKPNRADKVRALDMLGKYLSILNDTPPQKEDDTQKKSLSASERKERLNYLLNKQGKK